MTRKFAAQVRVSRFLATSEVDVEGWVRDALEKRLSDLRGPRGGHYVPVGDILSMEAREVGEDFMIGAVTYRATRMGRYVRPGR